MKVSGQLNTPTTLPQGKSPQYPLDRRLGGLQNHSRCSGEEKKSHYCPCQELNPSLPACSLSLY